MSPVRKVSLFREERGDDYGLSWKPYGTYDRPWWDITKAAARVAGVAALILGAVAVCAFSISAADRAGCHARWTGYNTSHSMFGGCVVEVAPGQWLPESKVNRGDFNVAVK